MPGGRTVNQLKFKAELIFPAVHVGPLMAPLYPFPEVSWAMAPVPSSKFQYPIKPAVGGPAAKFAVTDFDPFMTIVCGLADPNRSPLQLAKLVEAVSSTGVPAL